MQAAGLGMWEASASPQVGGSQMFLDAIVAESKLKPVVPN